MRYSTKPVLPALALLCWLGASSLATAADPAVRDGARLFSAESLAKANAALKEIQERTGKTVVIETYRGIPADKREAFRASRERFYAEWASARGHALNLNGVLYLVCRETPEDVAGGSPRTRVEYWRDKETEKLLTRQDCDQIKEKLGTQLARDANKGLLDAVTFARTTMETRFAKAHPIRNEINERTRQGKEIVTEQVNNVKHGRMEVGTLIAMIVIGLIAFWILIGLFRAFTRPRVPTGGYPTAGMPPQAGGMAPGGYGQGAPGYGQPYSQPMGYGGYPPQRSGFFGNLMAGMFGAAAGNFIYDRFFRGGSHAGSYGSDYAGTSAGSTGGLFGGNSSSSSSEITGGGDYAAPPDSTGGPAPNYDADITSQTDFGSAGGGGDFASNTGGGGDFSGGDFGGGGGGDFGGGGGGDFGGGGGGGDFGGGGGGDFGGGGGDY